MQAMITYNLLNLPQQITLSGNRRLLNTYAADGRKLSAAAYEGNALVNDETKYYNGNLVFDQHGGLAYILMPEGRITTNNGSFTFEYHLKDHLGGVRVAFAPTGSGKTVVQENAYYPFGAPIADLNYNAPLNTNRYKHTGMEAIPAFGLGYVDNGARWRPNPFAGPGFMSIDPLAEKNPHISPYVYCNNNPVRFIDPNGMDWYSYQEEYKDDNGDLQTRTQYKYVKGTMSDEDIQKGGYTHLGKTYTADNTYYSLGGAEIKYDKDNFMSLAGVQKVMSADATVIATINSVNAAGDFWNNYNSLIGTGSSAAKVLSEFMSASNGLKGTIGILGNVISGVNFAMDINSFAKGELQGIAMTDAIINLVSMVGVPGAAISLGYTAAKAGAKGIQRIERDLRNQVDRELSRHFWYWK